MLRNISIGIAVLMTFALIAGVTAQSLPMIISGFIVNEGDLSGFKVTCKNVRTDITYEFVTSHDGYFQFAPANEREGAIPGDDYIITVEGREQKVNDLRYIPIQLTFDLTGEVCPKCIECKTCPIDNTPYKYCDECCVPTECEECPEPTICPEPKECPEIPDKSIEILMALLGGLGLGVGGVYLKLGKTAKHLHKGIKNYHSIYTKHRNDCIRHPRGEIAPVYKQIDGEWTYIPKEER